MHLVTHLLAGWTLAETTPLRPRDRAWVAGAGVAPDLDGAGLLVDCSNKLLGRPGRSQLEPVDSLEVPGPLPGFDALDALGRDAEAHEVQDACAGHPEQTSEYHYHSITNCIADTPDSTGH